MKLRTQAPHMLDLTPRAIRRLDDEPPLSAWNVIKMVVGLAAIVGLALAAVVLTGGWMP